MYWKPVAPCSQKCSYLAVEGAMSCIILIKLLKRYPRFVIISSLYL